MLYLWTALYAASILLANITLNHFIPLPIFGLLSVGTIFFAAVFTLRDKLHVYGLRAVFVAIALALIVNYLAAVDYDTPPRFIVASFLAILIGELADTAIYQHLIEKSWLTRALSSNAVSIPLDTVLFTLLAFYGDMSNYDLAQIAWADIVFKTVIAGGLAFLLNSYKNKKAQYA